MSSRTTDHFIIREIADYWRVLRVTPAGARVIESTHRTEKEAIAAYVDSAKAYAVVLFKAARDARRAGPPKGDV